MSDDGCGEDLATALRAVQDRISDQQPRLGADTAATRRLLIEPVLRALGWNVLDPTQVECSQYDQSLQRHDREADYVLCVSDMECVHVKAAPLGYIEDAEVYMEDACRNAPHVGVATDGRTWKIWRNGSENGVDVGDKDACRRLSGISRDGMSKEIKKEDEESIRILTEKFNSREPDYDQKKDAEDTNRAVKLLMDAILSDKHRYRNDVDAFSKMELAYLNTLLWAKSKRRIRKRLGDIDGLDVQTRQHIIELSSAGRFWSLPRTYSPRDKEYRKEFLDLVELFANPGSQYGLLMERFEAFVDRTQAASPANLTGLFSSLRPDIFMPYNTRSVHPLISTSYGHLYNVPVHLYRRFNDLYRSISKGTGRNLVELDTIANRLFLDDAG